GMNDATVIRQFLAGLGNHIETCAANFSHVSRADHPGRFVQLFGLWKRLSDLPGSFAGRSRLQDRYPRGLQLSFPWFQAEILDTATSDAVNVVTLRRHSGDLRLRKAQQEPFASLDW